MSQNIYDVGEEVYMPTYEHFKAPAKCLEKHTRRLVTVLLSETRVGLKGDQEEFLLFIPDAPAWFDFFFFQPQKHIDFEFFLN